MKFLEKLNSSVNCNQSLICIGLDPDTSLIPDNISLEDFIRQIIEATSDLVCAYKINFAFFEAMGSEGYHFLHAARSLIPRHIPVIADAKRGDIGNTSRAYARAIFEKLDFDAVTVNPYMGYDSIQPFLEHSERGIFILCRTSNPGANDFQNLQCLKDENKTPLYLLVAEKSRQWNIHGNVGLVVGATCPEELGLIRKQCPEMPILIPGIGHQGGDVRLAVVNGTDSNGRSAIINSSRQIIHASRGDDFAIQSRQAANKLRKEINQYRRPF